MLQQTDNKIRTESYRRLGRTGLKISPVGFGCYRMDGRTDQQTAALAMALAANVNLIDTSTNYTDGESGKCVGRVFGDLLRAGVVARRDVIIVSKAGYVQGKTLEVVKQAHESGRLYPEMVEYAPTCWHSISPAFLEMQLSLSLERLNLPSIDIYLLHNPEYFLLDAARRCHDAAASREAFYARIKKAFLHLESEVGKGRISHYGISSNTFVQEASAPDFVSLERCLDVAGQVGCELYGSAEAHHFSVVQLPFNLLESGAVLQKNNGEMTVLEKAVAADLGVLTNRPLNAFAAGRVFRLASFDVSPPAVTVEEQRLHLVDLERRYGDVVPADVARRVPMNWVAELDRYPFEEFSAADWETLEHRLVRPNLMRTLRGLEAEIPADGKEEWALWRSDYLPQVILYMAGLKQAILYKRRLAGEAVQEQIAEFLPADLRGMSLSQQAIAAVAHCEGVSSVLVGMREPRYVTDVLNVTKNAGVTIPTSLFARLWGS